MGILRSGRMSISLAALSGCTALSAAWLVGCASTSSKSATSPPPQPIQTVQLGDNNLSCADLSSQIADLDKKTSLPTTSASNGTRQATSQMVATAADGAVTNAAVSAAATSGAIGAIPFVGGLMNMGLGLANAHSTNDAANKARSDANVRMEAMQRKQYLIGIFTKKNC